MPEKRVLQEKSTGLTREIILQNDIVHMCSHVLFFQYSLYLKKIMGNWVKYLVRILGAYITLPCKVCMTIEGHAFLATAKSKPE